MRRAYEKGFTVSDDYRKKTFRKPTEDKETIYLSTQELKQIDQYDCAVHLEKVKTCLFWLLTRDYGFPTFPD